MMGWTGWGAAGDWGMMVVMFVLVALAVAGLMLLFRPVFGAPHQGTEGADSSQSRAVTKDHQGALSIIEERYARGEIDREDFLALRRSLLDQQ